MPRDSRVYLEDILEATRKITAYTGNLSKSAFLDDEKTIDAVVRNLEVIARPSRNSLRIFACSTPQWNGRK
jgi:uncharacterized protein with HEPN domain